MGPLDMRGLVGAATIIGCLKYGACFSGLDDQDDPVFLVRLKDEDLVEAPDDSAFLQSLRFFCARVSGVYPPLFVTWQMTCTTLTSDSTLEVSPVRMQLVFR